ncbi:hypothetical protein NB689_003451 [Xanthomonas sacchari]|nr:hypothetical protein [Xanthomonas sacchari]
MQSFPGSVAAAQVYAAAHGVRARASRMGTGATRQCLVVRGSARKPDYPSARAARRRRLRSTCRVVPRRSHPTRRSFPFRHHCPASCQSLPPAAPPPRAAGSSSKTTSTVSLLRSCCCCNRPRWRCWASRWSAATSGATKRWRIPGACSRSPGAAKCRCCPARCSRCSTARWPPNAGKRCTASCCGRAPGPGSGSSTTPCRAHRATTRTTWSRTCRWAIPRWCRQPASRPPCS